MKTLKSLTFISGALIIIACNSSKHPDIPGTYVSSYKNEYTIGNDTLDITEYNATAGTYQIDRRTGYQKIREGKMLPKEFKKVKWTAVYDPDKQTLIESDYGRKIYVKVDQQSMLLGDTRFERLK